MCLMKYVGVQQLMVGSGHSHADESYSENVSLQTCKHSLLPDIRIISSEHFCLLDLTVWINLAWT